MNLVIPKKLSSGDKVACVSLSWGGAGDEQLRWRYEEGKKRLKEEFGLEVVEMSNTLNGTNDLYNHPEKRAKDLMDAFNDPSIKGIFSVIGGDDGIRLLPYIDFDVMKNNPKVFLGYSDTTIHHLMLLKANVRSYYGPAVLSEFAENVAMSSYTKEQLMKTLFQTDVIGEIKPSSTWTSEHVEWVEERKNQKRRETKNRGPLLLQGKKSVSGHLIGGCIDVLEMAKGTSIWPDSSMFDGAILFFETSEEMPNPSWLTYWLRNYGAMGIFEQISGIIFGKPFDEQFFAEYQKVIVQVVAKEFSQPLLPILYNMNFGHTAPMFTIPYGAVATIDCETLAFSIDEAGVK